MTWPPKLFEVYRAKLHRVIDGDTFELDVDLGFGSWTRQTIRLQDIDCPERNTEAGVIAKRATEIWFMDQDRIQNGDSVKGWVLVYPQKNSLGDFQRTFIRYVAEVRTYDGEHSLADDLRDAGYVKPS